MAQEKHIVDIEVKGQSLKDLRKNLNEAKNQFTQLASEFGKGSIQAQAMGTNITRLSGAVKQANSGVKEFTVANKMSSLQLLEMGENITAVAFGAYQLAKGIISVAKSFGSMLSEGATFGVLKDKFTEFEGGITNATKKLELLRQSSAGNLDEKNLIEYSNKMKLLGFTTDDTAKFLDIVERKSDEVGVSFDTGKSALEAFVLTGRGRGLKELGINIADVSKEMQLMSGLTKEQISKLEEEDQQTLRTDAIMKLYGSTIDQINAKQKDNADILASVSTAVENAKMEFEKMLSDAIVPLIPKLQGLLTEWANQYGGVENIKKKLTEFIGDVVNIAIPAILKFIDQLSSTVDTLLKVAGAFQDTVKWLGIFNSSAKDASSGGLLDLVLTISKIINPLEQLKYVISGFGLVWDEISYKASLFAEIMSAIASGEFSKAMGLFQHGNKKSIDFGSDFIQEGQSQKYLPSGVVPNPEKKDYTVTGKDKGSRTTSNKEKEAEKTWLEKLIEEQKKLTAEIKYYNEIKNDGTQELWIQVRAIEAAIEAQKKLNELTSLGGKKPTEGTVPTDLTHEFYTNPNQKNPRGFGMANVLSLEEYNKMLEAQKQANDASIQTAIGFKDAMLEGLGYVMNIPPAFESVLNGLMNFIQGMNGGGTGFWSVIGGIISHFTGLPNIFANTGSGDGGSGGGGHMQYRPTTSGGGRSNVFILKGDFKKYVELAIYEKGKEQYETL